MSSIETKKIRINATSKRDAKKLAELQADGWVISTDKRGETWFGQNNGLVTYVLTRTKGRSAGIMPPPVAPDGWYSDPVTPGLVRYWASGAWTEHTSPAPDGAAR